MKLYADETGGLIRVLKTAQEEAQYGSPELYTSMLENDPATNPLVLHYVSTDWNNTKLLDGVLTYKGNPVKINPPGAVWLAAIKEQESEGKAAAIPGWATWTEQEAVAWYAENVTNLIDAIPDIDSLSNTAYTSNAKAIASQMQDIIAAQALVIGNMARMLLALRDKSWPNL